MNVQRPVLVTVTATRPLTPRLTRVTFAGDDLEQFAYDGPDQLVRLFLPNEHDAELALPVTTDWWAELCALPESIRPVVRNYTVRRFDRAARELDIDFVLHEHNAGPGSAWAAAATTGQKIGMLSDGADYAPPADTAWQLLVGDESSLPAVASILESLPAATKAVVLLEVADEQDELPLTVPPNVTLVWLHRRGTHRRGALALADLRARDLPEGTPYAWVAGESTLATGVRRHLVNDRGVAKDRIYFCGYWRA